MRFDNIVTIIGCLLISVLGFWVTDPTRLAIVSAAGWIGLGLSMITNNPKNQTIKGKKK